LRALVPLRIRRLVGRWISTLVPKRTEDALGQWTDEKPAEWVEGYKATYERASG
jgi:hypothetical protein